MAQYHSAYDSFDHFIRFADPKFEYGVTLAKTAGRLDLRLADADVLPMTFEPFNVAVGKYVDEVVKLTDTLRQEAEDRNQHLDDKLYQSVDDPTQTYWVAPPRLDVAPYLNFAPLQNAAAVLKKSTAAYAKAYTAATAGGKTLPAEKADRLNAILMKVRACADDARGPAAPLVVRASDLRSRLLHRLRRQDPSRRPRGSRSTQLERGDRRDSPRRRHHRSLRRGDRQGDGGAGNEVAPETSPLGAPGNLRKEPRS